MSRWVFALLFSSVLALPSAAQDQPKQPAKPAAEQPPQEQEPPEEDANLKPKEYSFNPLQANKELQVGNEYWKKHSYKAAAGRFREATRWNPNLTEAWLRLGEAEEKRKNPKDAREAYRKYLELQPDAKDAAEIRRKIASLH
ncbi:MAG TPA: tetratricopeptide repeat protein [Bryobacteraceae bacterium]|nr:tetratricopeptide repeat protein [Bryobacteraceae bacterium]